MVGANFSIFGCSSSRRKSGVVIFKTLKETMSGALTGGESIISVVTKERVIDKASR